MIGRRGFLQTLIGVPLAVKAFVSPLPARLARPAITSILGWSSHDWFDFTISVHHHIERWRSWSDPSVVSVTETAPTEFTVSASCYGHPEDIRVAMLEDRPVVVSVQNIGSFCIRLDSVSFNVPPMDSVATTDITGTITETDA